MKDQVQLKGFRPGKVPVAHLRKTFGKSMMGEIVQEAVAESSQKAVEERSLRPAMSPQIQMVSTVEKVIAGGEDLVFTMGIDLMPDFKLAEPSSISLDAPGHGSQRRGRQESLKRLAAQQRTFEPKGDDAAGARRRSAGDRFRRQDRRHAVRRRHGRERRTRHRLGLVHPGLRRAVEGREGRRRARSSPSRSRTTIRRRNLAGKFADFDVTVKEVRRGVEAEVDESLATKLGLDSLDKLRDAARAQLVERIRPRQPRASEARAARRARQHPQLRPAAGMVEAEFRQIWAQVEQDIKAGNLAEEDKTKSEDELQGRVPQDRRTPRPLGPGAVRVRPREQRSGDAGRAEPRRRRAGAPVSRARKSGSSRSTATTLTPSRNCARRSSRTRSWTS